MKLSNNTFGGCRPYLLTCSTFDGNSICAGQGVTTAQRYSDLLWADIDLKQYFIKLQSNIGVGAQNTPDMIVREPGFLYVNLISNCTRNLVVAMEIRNDLKGGEYNAICYSNMVTYCQNAKNNGFDVILVMQPPSTGGADGGSPVYRTQAQLEIDRLLVRAMFLADFPNSTSQSLIYRPNIVTYADILCDVGGDSVMGNVAACADTNYFQDGTHPTALGHSLIAAIIKRAIQYYITLYRGNT